MNLPRLLVRGETLGHGAAKLFLQFPARDGASAKQDKLYTPALLRSRGSLKDVPRRFVKDVMRRKTARGRVGHLELTPPVFFPVLDYLSSSQLCSRPDASSWAVLLLSSGHYYSFSRLCVPTRGQFRAKHLPLSFRHSLA